MPGPYPYGETVVRLRRGPSPGRDPRGQPIPGPLVETPVTGCVVAPRQSTPQVGGDEQQARDTVIVGFTVYAPAGSDWRTTDQVRIRGELCEITGEPGDWGRNPFTGTRGPVQFAADRVTG
ncbi:hypothetical protein GT044_00590 [Streptomyces sp. SID335]|nr:hypothetical protein [Streptomyces sp. SID335]MYZ16508.1 hypothetical protein [Streptomyces sp. SID337]NDZ84475.1 hypothetical protein [Streptomyces sp. SID10115]NDZ98485.1 hypothetical protein [Streptomyces sp. SID10116]NEB43438.1 hypothetical protein [Streptomyces sp. SID339]